MKILLKKKSSFFPGKSLYFFFQNHTFANIFQKPSPRGCFWKFLKISPTCPRFNTHKKIVVHFFIPMLLLPLTPPLIYLKLKRFKGPKTDHFHFSLSLFHFFHFSLSLSLHFSLHNWLWRVCTRSSLPTINFGESVLVPRCRWLTLGSRTLRTSVVDD